MVDLLTYFLAGAILGAVTGLIPALHVNMVVLVIMSCVSVDVEPLCALIVGCAVSQLFFECYLAVYLSVGSSGDTGILLKPAQQLNRIGLGGQAIKEMHSGHCSGIFLGGALGLALMWFFPQETNHVYRLLRAWIGPVLLIVLVWFVARELVGVKGFVDICRRLSTVFFVFLLLVTCSWFALSGRLMHRDVGITALITGVFAAPVLLLGVRDGSDEFSFEGVDGTTSSTSVQSYGKLRTTLLSLGGMVVGLLPGISSSEFASVLSKPQSCRKDEGRNAAGHLAYLNSVSVVSGSDMVFSLLAIFLIGKARSGASIGVEELLSQRLSSSETETAHKAFLSSLVVLSMLLAIFWARSPFGAYVRTCVQKNHSRVRSHIDSYFYGSLLFSIGGFFFMLQGLESVLVFLVCGAVGYLALHFHIRTSSCMVILIWPTALFFMGFTFWSDMFADLGHPAASIHPPMSWKTGLDAVLAFLLILPCCYVSRKIFLQLIRKH